MATEAPFIGQWDNRTRYFAGQVVLFGGVYYSANSDNVNATPGINNAWSVVTLSVPDGSNVVQGTTADVAGTSTILGQLKEITSNTTGPSTMKAQNTFTGTGTGTLVTAPDGVVPVAYALSVKGTAVAADHWNVVLEGSLDGVNFTTLVTHTDTTPTADGITLFTTAKPVVYFRSRVVSITLGTATNIVVNVLGKD